MSLKPTRGRIVKVFHRSRTATRIVVLLLGLAVTGILLWVAAAKLPPKYEASASLMLLPGNGNIPVGANPFLYLGGLSQARDVLVKAANSDQTREELLRSRPSLDYMVQVDPTASAPIMLITSIGSDPEAVLELRDDLLKELPRALKRFQDDAKTPSRSRIDSMVLGVEADAYHDVKSEVRTLLAVAALGLGLTVAALAGSDVMSRRTPKPADVATSRNAPPPSRTRLEATGADGPSEPPRAGDPGVELVGPHASADAGGGLGETRTSVGSEEAIATSDMNPAMT